ncbi:MAG: SDR family NAD(P)-dependent oxidoreductase [Spirochaetia bacterium]
MRLYIITGSSRGLGLAIAQRALEEGALVHTVSRHRNDELDRTASDAGAQLTQHEFDLQDVERIPGLIDGIISSAGGPGGSAVEEAMLVNNAGVLEPLGPVRELSPAALSTHVAVNLTGLMQLTASFLSATSTAAYPRTVVNISSGAATKPYKGWGPYCATKAAVEMFTRVTALEEGDRGDRRIIAVAPGVVDTDMQALIRRTPEEKFPHRPKFVDLKESGKLADPAVAASLVLRAARDPVVESGSCVDLRKLYGS